LRESLARGALFREKILFPSRFMPCPDCGASLDSDERDSHACELERWLDYQMFQLRDELEQVEAGFLAYFDSPQGRFELWYARREREGPEPPAGA